MKKSREYLEEALEKLGTISDAKKSELLKIHKTTLSGYRNDQRLMDDFACIMVAQTLNIDPMEIIAAVQMEREKNEERRDVWADFRKKIGVLGLAGLIGAGTIATPSPAQAMTAKAPSEKMYIM